MTDAEERRDDAEQELYERSLIFIKKLAEDLVEMHGLEYETIEEKEKLIEEMKEEAMKKLVYFNT